MKQFILLAIVCCMIFSLFAVPLWEDPVGIRQNDQVDWNRCGAVTADGNMIYVWTSTKRGDCDIYAQKVTASGTLLWQQPIVVENKPFPQTHPVITRTTDNNFVIAWLEIIPSGEMNIRAQKITSNGQILWSAGGIPVCNVAQIVFSYEILADNNNGAYLVWVDSRNADYHIYGQHLDGFGNALWLADGMSLAGESGLFTMNPDMSGGLILASKFTTGTYTISLKRILSSGQTAWSEPLAIGLNDNNQPLQMCAIDDSSFVITWSEYPDSGNNDPDIFVQRFDVNGNFKWASPVCVYADSGNINSSTQIDPRITASGDNSVIIAWSDYRDGTSYPDIYAQKVSADGTLLWNNDGAPVCTEMLGQSNLRLVSDNTGGCYIVWDDGRDTLYTDIYAQHFSSTGSALWELQGKPICVAPNSQSAPMIRIINNNIFVGWIDERNGSPGMYYQVLNALGNPLLTVNGKLIYQGLGGGIDYSSTITLARSNDTVVLWSDYRNPQSGVLIYFQFLNPDGTCDLEANGKQVALLSGTGYWQNNFSAVVTPDDKIAIVWDESFSRVKAQLIDANGNRLWGDYGMYVTESVPILQKSPKISYEDGAFYIGWTQIESVSTPNGARQFMRVFGQKIIDNQKQWGADGMMISVCNPGEGELVELELENLAGRYYVWSQYSLDPDTFSYQTLAAKLVNADGSTAAGWLNEGIRVSNHWDWSTKQYIPQSIKTSAGLFVAWLDLRIDYVKTVYAQLISSQGGVQWNSAGLALSDSVYEADAISLINENDEITIFWTERSSSLTSFNKIQKIDLNGEVLLGESGYPVSLQTSSLSANYLYPVKFADGSMLAAWEQSSLDSSTSYWSQKDIYYRYINPNGSLTGSNSGICLNSDIDLQAQPRLAVVGNEAYLFWIDSDYYSNSTRCDEEPYEYYSLYAQKLSNEFVAIDDETQTPAAVRLEQNYPNPFNPTTNISFSLNSKSSATLTIYNQKGQKVRTIHDGLLDKGTHSFTWNGKDNNNKSVASGVYMYRLSSGNTTQTRKMVLLK